MKALSKILVIIAAALLIFAVLVGALFVIFTDADWVFREYCKIDIESQTGWEPMYCWRVLTKMMDYSIGNRDTLDNIKLSDAVDASDDEQDSPRFFNESELAHMVDVRKLTIAVLKLGLAAFINGFVLFAVGLILGRKEAYLAFLKSILIALGALVLLLAVLGIWMAIDFDSFWTVFHIVFLDLESSTFDPAVSNMIRICPAELFYDFIKHFALIAGICFAMIAAYCVIWLTVIEKKCKYEFDLRKIRFCILVSLSLCCSSAYLFTHIRVFGILCPVCMAMAMIFRFVDNQ